MKVLLSVYACEPGKGSEPGVGWRWALEIARLGHEVWALTRANNQPGIEAELAKMPPIRNLHFVYFDLPAWARWWKKGGRGVYLYYLLWQWRGYYVAKKAHAKEKFDLVHHLTFGTIRQPSFMGALGIPFIFGPVGGGERAPWPLRRGFGVRGWVRDAIRDIWSCSIRFDPLMLSTFKRAETIFVKTSESRSIVPLRFWPKTYELLEIGVDSPPIIPVASESSREPVSVRVLYVGRFLYLKGMHLGLAAFADLLKMDPTATLTMVGQGPEEKRWRAIANKLGIVSSVNWLPWVSQEDLTSVYRSHDVFLFPSLHDSSGNVVLEALVHELPVVALNLGGPGVILSNTCGCLVEVDGKTERDVIDGLAKELVKLVADTGHRRELALKSREMAVREYEWNAVVRKVYS